MAQKKVSNVISLLYPKAAKATTAQVAAFINGEVKEDLRAAIAGAWPDDMTDITEIAVTPATVQEYALPSDFYTELKIQDSLGSRVTTGRISSLDTNKNVVLIGSSALDAPVVTVDDEATFTKLIIHYEKIIDDVAQTGDDLPYPAHISEKIVAVIAKGVSYYYMRSRKKTTDVQFLFNEYEDIKAAVFQLSMSVSS